MIGFFLFLGACASVWKIGQYVSGFVEEQWLLDSQRRKLRDRFETWWLSIVDMRPRSFAVALARGAADALSKFFGKRLFSMRSFTRSAAIGTGLLMTSLFLTSLVGTTIKPWVGFDSTVQTLKEAPNKLKSSRIPMEDKAFVELIENWSAIAESYGSWTWKVVYCASFYLILTAANSVAFFLSVGLSRLILQEIAAAGRFFPACALLTFDLFLALCTASLFLLLTTVLAYPPLWFFLPLIQLVAQNSMLWASAVLFSGGVAAWAFGNPALQIASIIAIGPCLGTALICAVSLLALLNRERFHRFCTAVLHRCTEKKPLTFIVGFVGGVAVLIALLCRLIQML